MKERNAMSLGELTAWAWDETAPVHRSRANLLIHIVAVPLFVAGHVLVIASFFMDLRLLIAALACVLISLVMQQRGHAMEQTKVHPFAGPYDFLRRLYVEQFYNFWRFLFSGRWFAALTAPRA